MFHINPDRAAPLLFWTLLTVEVIRQRSFWITVLGDSWSDQLVAVGSAAAFSGAQWYLAHHLTRSSRNLLETPDLSRRQVTARLLILAPMTLAWGLQILAVGSTAALDIAMRLGQHRSPTALLVSTGLSEQSTVIVLTCWSVLVTSALLAGLTAIGIQTADGEGERQARQHQEHDFELRRLTDDRNRYQDLYNSLIQASGGSLLTSPQSQGSSPASSPEEPGSSPDLDEELLDLPCPHCDWTTGPRQARSARLALSGHKGGKHKGSKENSTSTVNQDSETP